MGPIRNRVLWLTAVLVTGCFGEGQIALDGINGPQAIPPPGEDVTVTPPVVDPDPQQHVIKELCETYVFAGITLDGVKADFAEHVHPLLTRSPELGGCTGCHGSDSARPFKVTASPTETFHSARVGGFLDERPSSLYDRLTTTVEAARMPQGAAAWTKEDVEKVLRVSCGLATVKESGLLPEPDEEFPYPLLEPYTGAAITDYDTRALDYPQLKAKVFSVFNDAWVRNSVDRFEENIAFFGGVNFTTRFVPSRTITSEYLLGLDNLAPDVCSRAATNKTGPFAGIDTSRELVDQPASVTTRIEAESSTAIKSTGQATTGGWNLYSNGTISHPVTFVGTGDFTFRVNARQTSVAGPDPARMQIRVDGVSLTTIDVPNTTLAQFSFTQTNLPAGEHTVAVAFINDYNLNGQDRNLVVDWFEVQGPLGSGTGTTRVDAARAAVSTLHQRILYRPATSDEITRGYSLLRDLEAIPVSLPSAWSGLCEALVRHPDFLFTRPPSLASRAGAEQRRLALVMLAQDLLGRPPTAQELDAYGSGSLTWAQQVAAYLALPEFSQRYFERFRLRSESNGTSEADEVARLWTYLMANRRPMQELFTGDYSVDTGFQRVDRPAVHGNTGVLTMKGFIKGKEGLPHYNYPARVLTDFMGVIFQVPAEVFDQRVTATAASTVDPTSACFSCHQLLTPLAHQRLKWDDSGDYRETIDGQPIDDSDRNMVATYPYKGSGVEAFSVKAARKEAFVRRTLNAQFEFLMGREMRHEQDERTMYRALWDLSHASATEGDLKAVLEHVLLSPTYRRHP